MENQYYAVVHAVSPQDNLAAHGNDGQYYYAPIDNSAAPHQPVDTSDTPSSYQQEGAFASSNQPEGVFNAPCQPQDAYVISYQPQDANNTSNQQGVAVALPDQQKILITLSDQQQIVVTIPNQQSVVYATTVNFPACDAQANSAAPAVVNSFSADDTGAAPAQEIEACEPALPVGASTSEPNPSTSKVVPREENRVIPKQRRDRTIYTRHQLEVLEHIFRTRSQIPNLQYRIKIGADLGITPDRLMIWFKNRRAKSRKEAKKLQKTTHIPAPQEQEPVINQDSNQSTERETTEDIESFLSEYLVFPKKLKKTTHIPAPPEQEPVINQDSNQSTDRKEMGEIDSFLDNFFEATQEMVQKDIPRELSTPLPEEISTPLTRELSTPLPEEISTHFSDDFLLPLAEDILMPLSDDILMPLSDDILMALDTTPISSAESTSKVPSPDGNVQDSSPLLFSNESDKMVTEALILD